MDVFYTTAGVIGAIAALGAYFANQRGWLSSADWRFPACNLIGSCLILLSLYAAWNLPSAIIEASWAGISLYGLSRRRLRARLLLDERREHVKK